MAKVTVVIPLYNKEADITATLKSVLSQTMADFELLIIDDGSTDNSAQVVRSVQDSRIRLISKQNEGVAKTRNRGVEESVTPWVAFMDADDYWHPFHLEQLVGLTKRFPEAKWVGCAYEKRLTPNNIVPMQAPIMAEPQGWMGPIQSYFTESLYDTLAWTSALAFRKDFFQHLGGFDPAITHGAGEDTDLWLRAALKSPLYFCNRISARHNQDGSNRISHTPTLTRTYMDLDRYEPFKDQHEGLKQYLDLNRYSLAIQHKMAGDTASFKRYKAGIDKGSLSSRQQWLLGQPAWLLKGLMRLKIGLEKQGKNLSSFKR